VNVSSSVAWLAWGSSRSSGCRCLSPGPSVGSAGGAADGLDGVGARARVQQRLRACERAQSAPLVGRYCCMRACVGLRCAVGVVRVRAGNPLAAGSATTLCLRAPTTCDQRPRPFRRSQDPFITDDYMAYMLKVCVWRVQLEQAPAAAALSPRGGWEAALGQLRPALLAAHSPPRHPKALLLRTLLLQLHLLPLWSWREDADPGIAALTLVSARECLLGTTRPA